MKRQAIITTFDPQKNDPVVLKDAAQTTTLPVLVEALPARAQVSLRSLIRDLHHLGIQPPAVAIDLFMVAVTVFAADTRISRSQHAQDGWSRELDLYIPVTDPALWETQTPLLQMTLGFLSGDRWRFFFRPRLTEINAFSTRHQVTPYPSDMVCLFSGGLDSFIGAIDLLEAGVKPLFLGHSKSADVSKPQRACAKYLQEQYASVAPEFVSAYVSVPKVIFNGGDEKTERGRSFLFLSLGTLFAAGLASPGQLVIPENGLISLNVPLTALRLGAASTRTTHPYFIGQFQQLLTALGLDVHLTNPYQCKTKGEMVRECQRPDILRECAATTMSCAHPSAVRYQKKKGTNFQHCGKCVPCIIRRAAFKAANQSDPTSYTVNFDTQALRRRMNEERQVQAFQMALARLNKNPRIADFLIYKPGPLRELPERIKQYAAVYRRGMAEVGDLLQEISTIRL